MLKKGDVLKNGAVVIEAKNNVVLADRGNCYEPFVTWEYSKVDGGDTYWGHYFSDIATAVTDFEVRVSKKL